MERLDIAIIGSGPAGLSAALNAKIRKKKFMLFGQKDFSPKVVKAPKIHNYLGFTGQGGAALKEQFAHHLKEMEIEITEQKINSIYCMGDYYTLMANDQMYEATSVILATGVNFGKPLRGELEFLGRGVGYCATCDAALYKDKVVVVIAYNKHEEGEANFLAEVASKVYYIPMYKEDVEVSDEIEVIVDLPVEILGDELAKQLVLRNQTLDVDGIFILRDSVAPDQLVPGLKLEGAHIEVDRQMKTNLPGCFAAGDVTGTPYQYMKAAGEGNVAALSAVAYLNSVK